MASETNRQLELLSSRKTRVYALWLTQAFNEMEPKKKAGRTRLSS